MAPYPDEMPIGVKRISASQAMSTVAAFPLIYIITHSGCLELHQWKNTVHICKSQYREVIAEIQAFVDEPEGES